MSNIRPLGDRVVVKPQPREETSRGGIIIPDTAKEKPQEGTVTAVGSGRLLDNGGRSSMELHEGDHVLYARYGGTEIILDDETYLVLRESDVLGIFASRSHDARAEDFDGSSCGCSRRGAAAACGEMIFKTETEDYWIWRNRSFSMRMPGVR
jgi:chaperonin GroES